MLLKFVHRKTKTEWQHYFKERVTSLRIFVQENGEISALAGFGIGAVIVLFYKAFALVLCLVVLLYVFIMLSATDT